MCRFSFIFQDSCLQRLDVPAASKWAQGRLCPLQLALLQRGPNGPHHPTLHLRVHPSKATLSCFPYLLPLLLPPYWSYISSLCFASFCPALWRKNAQAMVVVSAVLQEDRQVYRVSCSWTEPWHYIQHSSIE